MDPRASGGLLCSSQGYYDDCSGVGHKGPCSTENSYSTEERTRLISTVQDRIQDSSGFSLIALKPPSDFGADTVVGRIPGRLTGESLDRLSMTLQSQKQPIRLDEDQLTTDITDLEMTEKTLEEDTAAFEDITQDCMVCQIKVADFEAYNKSLSEELEVLAKAKDLISEKTDDSEYRENRSMLSSHGSLVISLSKIEHSIGLTQLASRVDFAMHAETSNGDDPFAKVKGLTRLEEKASDDATHKAFEATHIFNSMHSVIEMVRFMTMSQHKDLYLTTSMISFALCSWPEVMNIMLMCDMKSSGGCATR